MEIVWGERTRKDRKHVSNRNEPRTRTMAYACLCNRDCEAEKVQCRILYVYMYDNGEENEKCWYRHCCCGWWCWCWWQRCTDSIQPEQRYLFFTDTVAQRDWMDRSLRKEREQKKEFNSFSNISLSFPLLFPPLLHTRVRERVTVGFPFLLQ